MRQLREVLKREWRSLLATAVGTSLVTVFFVFGFAGLTSGAQRDLADRVDKNAQLAAQNVVIARAGVDSIVCILAINPEKRDDRNIRACMDKHGYLPFYTK